MKPSNHDKEASVYPKTINKAVLKIINGMSFLVVDFSMGIKAMREQIPNIIKIFNILLPTIFPMDKSALFSRA